MVRITEDLIRKRAEHNECLMYNLEEIALHQENIERIENLDKWCKELKILYLHSNVIPKIENVSRLKKLEYLNLTLNNVLKIENLEGCESLQKLDLTLNFIAELTSVDNLKNNYNLEELYLTGNPCTDYEYYRQYIISTLPQLKILDGKVISKSERIQAIQNYSKVLRKILQQQKEYFKKAENCEETEESSDDSGGAYSTEKESRFWSKISKPTPKSRIKIHQHIERRHEKEQRRELDKKPKKRQPRLFSKEGRPLGVNQAKLDFILTDDGDSNRYLLDLAIYKYLDTSLLDVDVQPYYVRVIIKGKIFQLCLQDEIMPSSSTAQRSETTGHLLITMPKAKEVIQTKKSAQKEDKPKKKMEREYLEVTGRTIDEIDKIVSYKTETCLSPLNPKRRLPEERPNSNDFVDDPDVPPLC